MLLFLIAITTISALDITPMWCSSEIKKSIQEAVASFNELSCVSLKFNIRDEFPAQNPVYCNQTFSDKSVLGQVITTVPQQPILDFRISLLRRYKTANQSYNVILHELGHAAGLHHSDDIRSIMHFKVPSNERLGFSLIDVQELSTLHPDCDPHYSNGPSDKLRDAIQRLCSFQL